MKELPRPEVVRCYVEESVNPPLPAMQLDWDESAPGAAERCWSLPGGVSVRGPAPARFGVTIYRRDDDAYQVRVLWDDLCLSWERLRRVQIMASALAPVLSALGTDLWYLLTQPAPASEPVSRVA